LLVNKLQYLRSVTPPDLFAAAFMSAVPEEAGLLLAQPAFREKACKVYVHETPSDACVKYLANFSLGYKQVESIVDHMLATMDLDEAAFCDETYMRPDQLQMLETQGHMIACYGHTHRPLGAMRPDAMMADVSENLDVLTGILGHRPRWISFSYGRGDAVPRDTDQLCETFGFSVGLTLSPSWNYAGQDPFRVCRVTENQYAALMDRPYADPVSRPMRVA
jgi:hypothetical protein